MSDINDLRVLTKTNDTLLVAGKELIINRIRIKQVEKILTLAAPMADMLMKSSKVNLNGKEVPQDPISVPAIIARHANAIVALVAEIESIGNEGVDEEWVGNLELDDMILLATRVVEVNLDFFIQRVLPMLSTGLVALTEDVRGKLPAGSPPSKP